MDLKTAAEVIGLCRNIEDESAKYYESLAETDTGNRQLFLTMAADDRKYIKQIERAYYGVITDALEGCFAFNMQADDDIAAPWQAQDNTNQGAITTAIRMEERIVKFYADAAEQCKALLADVPYALAAVAKKRKERPSILNGLQGKGFV